MPSGSIFMPERSNDHLHARKHERRPFPGMAPFVLSDSKKATGVTIMMDIILLGTAILFFALCFAYARACDRL